MKQSPDQQEDFRSGQLTDIHKGTSAIVICVLAWGYDHGEAMLGASLANNHLLFLSVSYSDSE